MRPVRPSAGRGAAVSAIAADGDARERFLRGGTACAKLSRHPSRDDEMKRAILIPCAGLLLAACPSGADVADGDTSPDSAVVQTLEGIPPQQEAQPTDTQP